MGKITENIGGDVLYICGANHIQSFKFLLIMFIRNPSL